MNWDAINAIAEMLGAVAVVVTLGYLARQVRQGNLLAKYQARQRMLEQAHSELYAQMADPSITHASVKDGPLTEDEQARLSVFLAAFMRQREWEWFQLQDGVIDADVYRSYHDVIPIHLGTERTRKWWSRFGRYAFDPRFVKEVDELLDKTEVNDYLRTMRTWDNAE